MLKKLMKSLKTKINKGRKILSKTNINKKHLPMVNLFLQTFF